MELNLPLISVIMPSFNSGRTVEKAVRSVMEQTYPNTEAIVVDNSSADDTAEKVRALADQYFFTDPETGEKQPRIRLIVQPNHGVSSARNAGIRAARGEWFVSLDSDDYYDPETILTLWEAVSGTAGNRAGNTEAADTALCGIRKVYEDGVTENVDLAPSGPLAGSLRTFLDECFTQLYDLHLIQTHSNQIYRTQLVREHAVYYREELSVNEDIDFVLRYLKGCRRAAVVPDIFLNYVQHSVGQSLINTFQPHGLKGALIVLKSCDELMDAAGAGAKVREEMDQRLFVHICSFAGLMYYRSNYSDLQIREEIRELCGQEDFRKLLGRLKPKGIKNRIACFLLKNRWDGLYHRMCRTVYRGK